MPILNPQTIAQFSVERILNCTVEGIAIALFAWLLLRLVGRQNSGTRFAVWFSTLIAIAVLPLVGPLSATASGAASRGEISLPVSWALGLFAAWAFIAAVNLARVGVGLWQLRKLRSKCTPIPMAQLDDSLQKTLAEFDSIRNVTLCVSSDLRMPAAIGYLKPLVVLPDWALEELSAAESNSIVLHELAHLRRWDDFTNLAQKILGALLFFHPAVWWIEGRLGLEREMACDDLVLARTESPKDYAECLVSLAEKGFLRRGLALAQAAVSRMRDTSLRVTRILDANRPGGTRVWRPALVVLSAVATLSVAAAPHLPRLVSLDNPVPAAAAVATVNDSPVAVDGIAPKVVKANMTTSPQAAYKRPASSVVTHRHKAVVPPVKTRAAQESPLLAQSRMSQDDAVPPTVLVVMQTQQFRGPDSTVWTFCVWRVTVLTPAQRKLNSGIVAKST